MKFLKVAWVICTGLATAAGYWRRAHGDNLGDVTTVAFWQLMILGFPTALVGYVVSFAVIVGVSAVAVKAGATLEPWTASAAWSILHLATAASGYWLWFALAPKWRKGVARGQ